MTRLGSLMCVRNCLGEIMHTFQYWYGFRLLCLCFVLLFKFQQQQQQQKSGEKKKSYKQAQAEINANKNIIIKFYSILLLLCLIESSYECVHLPFPGCECLSFERKDVGGKD